MSRGQLSSSSPGLTIVELADLEILPGLVRSRRGGGGSGRAAARGLTSACGKLAAMRSGAGNQGGRVPEEGSRDTTVVVGDERVRGSLRYSLKGRAGKITLSNQSIAHRS